ncbi:MAG: lipoprotein [Pseudomonas sp.]|nr:lipoprotein [Pseudomonas sp.]
MFRRIAVLSFALLLSACDTARVNHDFDATRDFGAYRSWSWKEPGLQYQPDDPRVKSDLTEQRIRQSVGDLLDQRGLRMAPSGAKPDVTIQAFLIVEDRQQMISTSYGGGPWGGSWQGGYWGGAGMTETRNVDYKVSTLQIDMLDGKDGKLVWRGSSEQTVNMAQATPVERDTAIRQTVAKVLEQYPPH